MPALKAFFIFECKRFINKKNLALFMLLLLISLFPVQTHINRYNTIIENNRKYNETERLKVKQFLNYTQYGLYGFRVFFNPSPISILFSHSGAFRELTSNIDAGEKMNFYSSMKGKTLFGRSPVGFMDFAGLIMLLGSLFALYTGYESLRHKEYLKFVSSLSGYKKAYFSMAVSRAFFMLVFFLPIMGAALFLLRINGIEIPGGDTGYLAAYVVVTVPMLLFFFICGMIGAGFKSRVTGVVTILSLWFGLVFLVPWVMQAIILESSESIRSNARMELDKLKYLMDFEKKAYREIGIFKSGGEAPEEVKELAESYWKKEFKAIQAVEEEMRKEIETQIRHMETFSLFFPTSFHLMTNNALSGKGYRSFLGFYSHVQALKRRFLRFYIDRKFYTDHTGVDPFLKEKENIYDSGPLLPGNFYAGLLMLMLYMAGGGVISYYRFKGSLFSKPGKGAKGLNALDIELKKGETFVMLTNGGTVGTQLYNFFSGQAKGFKGQVRLEDMNPAPGPFLYLCRPWKIPGDIKVGDFFAFIKRLLAVSQKTMAELYIRLEVEHIEHRRLGELRAEDRVRVMTEAAQLKNCTIYMLQDFVRGLPADFLKHVPAELQKLKDRGAAVLYLTDDVLLASRIGDSAGSLQAPTGLKLENYDLV